MNRSPVWRAGALLAGLTLVAAACGDDDDTAETQPPASETTAAPGTTAEPVTTDTGEDGEGEIEGGAVDDPEVLNVAYLLPQSGQLAEIVDALLEPLRMGVEEINAVGDTTVNLFGADSGTDAAVAGPAVDALLGEEPSAILGAAASTVTLSVIDKITGEGIVECSGSNTGAVLTDYDDNDFYFRTAPSDILQGPALADVISADGHLDVAIAYRNDEYGSGFNDSLAAALEDAGANVVAQVGYDPNATTFDGEAQQLASANPEAIAMISFAEGAQLLQAAIGQGIGPDSLPWYVADGFKDNVTADAVNPDDPGALVGIRGTAPSAAPEELGEPTFPKRFAEFAGEDTPTIFSAQFYDCLMVTTLASEQADSTDPADIRDNMNAVTKGGTTCTTYEDCHKLLVDGEDIDYDGASGPLDFTDAGEPSIGTYDVYTYDAEGAPETDEQIVISRD